MSQINQIGTTLKKLLRQQNITYKDIAEKLSMSEANIKRIFSTERFSLQRLESICEILNLNLFDLMQMVEQQSYRLTQLTELQEQELVSDDKLFLVAVCVRDSWTFDEIINHYQLTEHECIRMLAKLDKLKLIQLLPNNDYKLLIAQHFRWIPDGPLERCMSGEVIKQFMSSSFKEDNCFRFYLRGTYSQSSIDIIQRKFTLLTEEAAVLNQEDSALPLKHRQHIGLLIAMRPWELDRFSKLRKVTHT